MKAEHYKPTHLVFGGGTLSQLGKDVRRYGQKALVVTGVNSVKRYGTMPRVIASLQAFGIAVVECSGVESNPRISSVVRGVQIARDQNCDVIIALGGSSVIDAAKVMAAAVYYEGEPWDMFYHSLGKVYLPTRALPIVTVPTLITTGSERNNAAVVYNDKTNLKSFIVSDLLYPRITLVDPELTLSVPQDQTAYGVCDLITRVTEGYLTGFDGSQRQEGFLARVIQTAMEWGPKSVFNGSDLEARTQIQWASVVAFNGWAQVSINYAPLVFLLAHTLCAYHDISHGAALAVVNLAWMRFAVRTHPARFAQFARRIFGLRLNGENVAELAKSGIDHFEAFLKYIGCPTRLPELGIGDKLLHRYAKDTLLFLRDDNSNLPGSIVISESDIINVLMLAL
ncbi:MAG: iron-containing alcohol dehydrogenase [Pedobacter sp.]